MTISTCVAGLVAEGRISQGKAAEAERLYNRSYHALKHTMGPSAAATEASERAIKALELQALRSKRYALLQMQAQADWLARQRGAVEAGAPLARKAAEDEIVAMDGARESIRKQALGMMEAMLAKHRRNLIGEVREKSDLTNVVRELYGTATGDVNAREIADAWRKTGEWLRSRFNAAGGNIAKLDSWALPQRHDMRAVRDAGFEAWRDVLVGKDGAPGLLDRSKMVDHETGLPLTDERLEELLADMHRAIASDGWSRNNAGGIRGASTANAHAEHRVLHFADGDAWAAYAERFGGGSTAMDAMLAHIEGMARDVAAIEAMGPNPAASLRFQQDWLRKSAADHPATGREAERQLAQAEKGVDTLQQLYDAYSGANLRPVSKRLAVGFSIFRAQQVAAKLGGAFLSIGGDFGTMIHTARFNDLPVGKTLARYGKLMNPANMEDRRLAARLGLISDEWASMTATSYRYTGEEMTHEMSRRMAEGVLRLSGLSLHTEAAQMAFGMELLSTLTQSAGRSWDNLDPGFRNMLDRYRIDAARWDRLRATPRREVRGTDWIFPEDVGEQGLADDLVRMMQTEADYAIPMPDLRTRAFIESMGKRGTWGGELARSVFLFKGFPLSILNLHGRRMLEQPGMGNRAKYGAGLLLLTTAGGALSLQAKELAKGRDPQEMDRAGFWARAGLQGGGLGIFGDLIAASENRFGGGIAATAFGPGAQVIDNSAGAVTRNVTAMVDGDEATESKWGKDAVKLLGSETPGLSLWYGRLAVERLVKDVASEWVDPGGTADAYARLERRAEEQGTGYWAPPGSRTDWRAPDFGNALGEAETPEP